STQLVAFDRLTVNIRVNVSAGVKLNECEIVSPPDKEKEAFDTADCWATTECGPRNMVISARQTDRNKRLGLSNCFDMASHVSRITLWLMRDPQQETCKTIEQMT